MSEFLDLPPELILACLLHLSSVDLASCVKSGSGFLCEIVAKSIQIRYRLEQERANVHENPSRTANLPLSDRLAGLRRLVANWLNFTPNMRCTLPVHASTGVYDLTSDVYLVADAPDPITHHCTGIKYTFTTLACETPQWRRIDTGRPIIDFGTAFEEHDLIAIVTYTQCEHNAQQMSIDVVFLQFSTGDPHPLAAHPTLHIHTVPDSVGIPAISIEIVGENMAMSLVYWDEPTHDLDLLRIFNWYSGLPKIVCVPTLAHWSLANMGIVFLTPSLLLVTNTDCASFDVFDIPASPSPSAASVINTDTERVPDLLFSFLLPTLHPSHSLISYQCRGAPNPLISRARRNEGRGARFLPLAESALVVFSFGILDNDDDTDAATEHMFVLDRAGLLGLMSPYAPGPDRAFNWGTACTRFLDADTVSTYYITMTCGQRMVAIAHDARERPAPIRVLDFNPARVRAYRESSASPAHVRLVGSDIALEGDASEEEEDARDGPFAERITLQLPYLETTSEELFAYGAVSIDDYWGQCKANFVCALWTSCANADPPLVRRERRVHRDSSFWIKQNPVKGAMYVGKVDLLHRRR
ncbi:hypothetical protein DFH09DRAFT_928742 [Mycena vulgaris]|nr:hypothetical protein DFH09DRAFT_928742 [Mycena vulgaris]